MEKRIQAGVLRLSLTQGSERLDELVDFASRENQKRGFLFVSKVLGKHIPVRPSLMRSIYDELADQCDISGNCYVFGLAETATGLGAGVADSLSLAHPETSVFFHHTTRHTLNHPLWFTISENHSHAVSHLVYRPQSQLLPAIEETQTLILVDDEITTGNTLRQLAKELIDKLPKLKKLIIVSLVSWLDASAKQSFANLPLSVEFVNLIEGQFAFDADMSFSSQLPADTDSSLCDIDSRDDIGRTAIQMPYRDNLPSITTVDDSVVIVGTGEHLYLPFLTAERLEQLGKDVLFQSTTRSPILMGDGIGRKIKFDVSEQKVNYIYNLPKDKKPIVLCETQELADSNGFYQGHYQEVCQ